MHFLDFLDCIVGQFLEELSADNGYRRRTVRPAGASTAPTELTFALTCARCPVRPVVDRRHKPGLTPMCWVNSRVKCGWS